MAPTPSGPPLGDGAVYQAKVRRDPETYRGLGSKGLLTASFHDRETKTQLSPDVRGSQRAPQPHQDPAPSFGCQPPTSYCLWLWITSQKKQLQSTQQGFKNWFMEKQPHKVPSGDNAGRRLTAVAPRGVALHGPCSSPPYTRADAWGGQRLPTPHGWLSGRGTSRSSSINVLLLQVGYVISNNNQK